MSNDTSQVHRKAASDSTPALDIMFSKKYFYYYYFRLTDMFSLEMILTEKYSFVVAGPGHHELTDVIFFIEIVRVLQSQSCIVADFNAFFCGLIYIIEVINSWFDQNLILICLSFWRWIPGFFTSIFLTFIGGFTLFYDLVLFIFCFSLYMYNWVREGKIYASFSVIIILYVLLAASILTTLTSLHFTDFFIVWLVVYTFIIMIRM